MKNLDENTFTNSELFNRLQQSEQRYREIRLLLRETAYRANLALPVNDRDEQWFNDGTDFNKSGDFMLRLFQTLGLTDRRKINEKK